VPLVDAFAILGDMNTAVRVMSYQVSLDLVGGNDFGLMVWSAFSPVDMIGHFMQVLGSKDRHYGYLLVW
jgi:hypothetical protein